MHLYYIFSCKYNLLALGLIAWSLLFFPLLPGDCVHAVEVVLDWEPPPGMESRCAGYTIHYGTESRVYEVSIDVGKNTNYLVIDLHEGQHYYFAVTAYDMFGFESGYSNEVEGTFCISTLEICDGLDNDCDSFIDENGNAFCDNGLYCDGQEYCGGMSGCQPGSSAVNCDDGVSCTDDFCNEMTDSCDNEPKDANCDDGLYCNGTEICDVQKDCQIGTSVCDIGQCGVECETA